MYIVNMDNGLARPLIDNVEDPLYNDELTHYGVKGMKWGVRKQQPTSGNKRRGAQSKTQQNKSKATNRGRKTAAVALAAIGGTALASYGVYRAVKGRKDKAAAQRAREQAAAMAEAARRVAAARTSGTGSRSGGIRLTPPAGGSSTRRTTTTPRSTAANAADTARRYAEAQARLQETMRRAQAAYDELDRVQRKYQR